MRWIALLSIFALLGCSVFKKNDDASDSTGDFAAKQGKMFADFEKGNRLLDENKPEEAAVVFDQMIVDNPVSQIETLVIYNSGIAHLLIQNCELASERFRKVIRLSAKTAPTIRGRALLRMSDVYTCLGEDNKAILTLVEIVKGKFDLPVEVIRAEVPAKLATAYARMGNIKEANRYFQIAERGLVQVETSYRNPQERTKAMGMTLFLMGNTSQINIQSMSSDEYFATIKSLQRYLYRAVELNAEPWSEQAAQQIMQLYKNTWSYIDRVPPGPSASANVKIGERERRQEQVRVAQVALQSLRSLLSERIPDKNEPSGVKQLIQLAKTEETKLRNYLALNIVGSELTPEAREASALKRQGQVANPNPVLERQAKKRQRK